jgi:hypothetical protein
MILIAVSALGLAIAAELQEGSPPRFVVRGIPKRIARLRPGMTWEETREILGLEQTWLTGGTGARFAYGERSGHYMHEVYYVRPPRVVVQMAQVGASSPTPVKVLHRTAMIQLGFGMDYPSRNKRLVRASFSSDSMTIAEMTRSH